MPYATGQRVNRVVGLNHYFWVNKIVYFLRTDDLDYFYLNFRGSIHHGPIFKAYKIVRWFYNVGINYTQNALAFQYI